MLQSHVINVLPRQIMTSLWAAQETRISLSHLASAIKNTNYKHPFHKEQEMPVASSPTFLCSELPVRYTHILRLLSTMSPDALRSPIIRYVAHSYLHDICTLLHPSLQSTSDQAFRNMLKRLRQRQAANLIRLRYALSAFPVLMDNINTISFGIHILLDQHLSWSDKNGNQTQVVNPIDVASTAIQDARATCSAALGKPSPEIHLVPKAAADDRRELTFIPNLLHRIIYESTLVTLKAHIARQQKQELLQGKRHSWLRTILKRGSEEEPIAMHVFGGPTSVGFRLTSSAPLLPSDLQAGIPRDPLGIPTCASVLSQTKANTVEKDDHYPEGLVEWEAMSGWRSAQALASHFGGNLDVVSVDGLGTSVYLALDRDAALLERYPSRSLSSAHRLLRHHGRISAAAAAAAATTASPLTLQAASVQLDTFLSAIANPGLNNIHPTPLHHHHSVSLSAAVGHA